MWLKKIKREVIATSVIKGNAFMYYLKYFITRLIIVSKKLPFNIGWSKKLWNWLQSDKFVIKNEIGTFCVNPGTDSIIKSSPLFEPELQEFVHSANHKKAFIDIGANIGFYAVFSTQQAGFEQCYAFEPNPAVFPLLKKTMELNSVQEQAEKIALSNKEDTLRLSQNIFHTGASSIERENEKDDQMVSTPSLPFDTYMKSARLQPSEISFIKIDVEGHERNVLEGMKKTLHDVEAGTKLLVEIWPDHNQKETKNFILKRGFKELSGHNNNFLFTKVSR